MKDVPVKDMPVKDVPVKDMPVKDMPKTDGRSLARLDRETVPASASCVLAPCDGIDHGLYAPCMVKNSITRRSAMHGRLLHGALSGGACCGQRLRRVLRPAGKALARCAICIVPTDHGRP